MVEVRPVLGCDENRLLMTLTQIRAIFAVGTPHGRVPCPALKLSNDDKTETEKATDHCGTIPV